MTRSKSRSDIHRLSQREIPDQQTINAADQYLAASELLNQQPPGSGVLLPKIVFVELYLKSLVAERIYTEDAEMPEMSLVSAQAQITGHSLTKLMAGIPDKIRVELVAAYDTQLRPKLRGDFGTILGKVEGAFVASRYPFEPAVQMTKYSSTSLVHIAKFLQVFVKSIPVQRLIE